MSLLMSEMPKIKLSILSIRVIRFLYCRVIILLNLKKEPLYSKLEYFLASNVAGEQTFYVYGGIWNEFLYVNFSDSDKSSKNVIYNII